MTPSTPLNPLTREELIELAALDALGLLDEFEAVVYTRSFHDAPATVQDEIIGLQAEISGDEAWLPDVAPTPALRDKVLETVQRAIDREIDDLSPLATIGRRRFMGDSSAFALQPAAPEQRNTSLYWRAACFVLAAALVVTFYFMVQFNQRANHLTDAALMTMTQRQLEAMVEGIDEDLGRQFANFVRDDSTERMVVKSAGSGSNTTGQIWLDQATNECFIVLYGVPNNGESYTLTLTDDVSGDVVRETFAVGLHGLAAVRLTDVSMQLLTSASWNIADVAGSIVLEVV